ncbi:MAG: MurR/RpiR family transcriptional regulator [Pseudoxanthomonas sp.]
MADFILENAQLLRDYSSQQLATALRISQSSVVKFSQKLGFKGYPDLKYSIGEAIARADNGDATVAATATRDPNGSTGSELWQRKCEAEEETRLINPPEAVREVADAIGGAGKIFIIGFGEDAIHAAAFAWRLSLLGIPTIHNFDAAHMTASVSAATAGDVLLVFCEDGTQTALSHICQHVRKKKGKVITVTRHSSNALRAHADLALLVSAHDDRPHIEPLLYRSALQHLLDGIFVMLCEGDKKRFGILQENLERMQPALNP